MPKPTSGRRNCTPGKSYECGASCISVTKTCRIAGKAGGGANAVSSEALAKTADLAKEIASLNRMKANAAKDGTAAEKAFQYNRGLMKSGKGSPENLTQRQTAAKIASRKKGSGNPDHDEDKQLKTAAKSLAKRIRKGKAEGTGSVSGGRNISYLAERKLKENEKKTKQMKEAAEERKQWDS